MMNDSPKIRSTEFCEHFAKFSAFVSNLTRFLNKGTGTVTNSQRNILESYPWFRLQECA